MRYVWIALLVLSACRVIHAQMPTLTLDRLTTKDGLPSNDVWSITKDKQGFLWVGTGRSVCRYDGYTFQPLNDEKLGYCSGLSTAGDGTVYASIATKGLCAINPQSLTVSTILANNYGDADRTNDTHDRAFVDSYNQVWVCDYTSVKRYDPAHKSRHLYALSSTGNSHQDATFFEDRQRRLWIVSEIGLYAYDRQKDRVVCLLGQEARQPKNSRPIRLEMAFDDANGAIWMGAYDNGLVRFSPSDSSFRFVQKGFENQNVICGKESVDENDRKLLFVGSEKGLSLYYPDRDELYPLTDFFNKGIHVKTMFDDTENGILWIGTREGLYKYKYRNTGIHTVDIPANLVPGSAGITCPMRMPNGNYLLGLSQVGALAWQPATNSFRLEPYPVNAYTYQLRWIQNRPIVFTDKGVFAGNPISGRFSTLPAASQLFTSMEFRDGLLDRKGRFWLANLTEGLKVIDPATNQEIKLWPDVEHCRLIQNNYIKAIEEGVDGKIWIATCPNGLYYFDEQLARFVNILTLPVNKGKSLSGLCINALHRSRDGGMLMASWGGVNKIAASGQIITSFDYQHDKLADTYCSNIFEDKAGNLWFSTNEGLHIGNPKTRTIKYLSTIEGLHSNYPVGFLDNGADELILGYVNALNIVDVNSLHNAKTKPRIVISSVEVKGKRLSQDLTREIVVQPDENQLTLNFSALNFDPATQNTYSYQLEGFDANWVNLGNQHAVSFTNLPPGSYTLQVKSSNSFGLTSDKPLVLRLLVKPYFTDTWFFKLLIGFAVAGLVVGIMRWRMNTLAERNRLDLEVTEWRLKALQSQMNPHFLFNSLNSVQNYLLTNRSVEGAKYLSKFSKLVRRIMENSNHQYLSFEQIIDTLRMYVEIESFRFNQEFSYAFDIEDDERLMDAMLPPMLLQPYVENAIWHGLMPKEGEKKVTISARVEQDHIVCVIEDNGVGRAFAPRAEGHISRGQEMTRGIFESLRHKDSSAKIELIDLFDATGKPSGTRVQMTIPL
ncbi:two-component regulator propeller domain-containing protein [Spirosoma gilvum]